VLVVSAGKMTRPVWMVVIGFVLVLVGGIVMPYLMLSEVGVIPLEKLPVTLSFLIPLFSYGMSVAGLFLGIIGTAMYVRNNKPPQHPSNPGKHS
jgi:hypothetical protein